MYKAKGPSYISFIISDSIDSSTTYSLKLLDLAKYLDQVNYINSRLT